MKSRTCIAFVALALAAACGPACAGLDEDGRAARHARKARNHAHRMETSERLTADQREYERARAENVDPGGSYAAYPDWARYALAPKGGNR